MKIDTLVLGDIQANCYCIRTNEDAADCALIDPGLNPEPLVRFLTESKLNPVAILLTHGHADHIGGVETIRQEWPAVRVMIHRDDAPMLTDPNLNLSILAGTLFQGRPADDLLGDEDAFITAAGIRLQVLHTPGHTPGGICLYSATDQVLFAGDTLFAGSVGRSDFPGGSHSQLIQAIRDRLLILPENTTVYPGHGPTTSLRNEKKHNPYL